MANRIKKDVRKLILDDLILIGSVCGGQMIVEFTKRVCPYVSESTLSEINRHMYCFDDWDFPYLFDQILDLETVPDKDFIIFCEQYVHPIFRRTIYDEDSGENIDLTLKCIDAINTGLSDVGLKLSPEAQMAGRTIYKIVPTTKGGNEPIKNIIFAAKYKPDIVIDDVLSNSIKVVKANGALIYDQGIPAEGISWINLLDWYKSIDSVYTEESMIDQFIKCLDSEAEKLFFKAYISYINKHGKHLPALIPQVYLYYDPQTQDQRGLKIFEHQKMDFIMIITPSQRVVIEIDGKQHYSEDEVVPGTNYKYYSSPKRYSEMMKAHREMSLTGYDVFRFGGYELWVNSSTSENAIIAQVENFFSDLFSKYRIE